MNVEFRGAARDDRHGGAILVEGAVDGRPIHLVFTRDAIRTVAPSVADGRDLLARLISQREVFAAVVVRKLRAAGEEVSGELTITEADMLSAADGVSGEIRWPDGTGRAGRRENEFA